MTGTPPSKQPGIQAQPLQSFQRITKEQTSGGSLCYRRIYDIFEHATPHQKFSWLKHFFFTLKQIY